MNAADLAAIREFCINSGIDPAELDNIQEPPVIKDIGQALMLSLQNDNSIGSDIMTLYMLVFGLMDRIAALEGGGE